MEAVEPYDGPVTIAGGRPVRESGGMGAGRPADNAPDRGRTISERIFAAHGWKGDGALALKFDALVSHDITYVGIVQSAVAAGLERFPVPYALTNCHNSLCAVGGTINADDHAFGLSAAKRFGGMFVPPNLAVIHQYAREELAGCGKMILGSDSHTRYGAIGAMGVGEGGPELVKQLLGDRWEAPRPRTVLVWLSGAPARGVGPHDAALALCKAVYGSNFAKNAVLEFAGPGVASLDIDFRLGLDAMTTETACLSSIWETDGAVEEFYAVHGRPGDYARLSLEDGARYDGMVSIDLSRIEPMAALPFHPSDAVTVAELAENAGDMLREIEKRAAGLSADGKAPDLSGMLEGGRLRVPQGVIAGCAGGMYSNIAEAAAILDGAKDGCGGFELAVYPSSSPVDLELTRNGVRERLAAAGAVFKPCFCGPCFGAGDVPADGTLSVRHVTRNFPNREGSRPGDGQFAGVVLMDARSIAATARNGGFLTPASSIEYEPPARAVRRYDREPYARRVYCGTGRPSPETPLKYGPNIAPWPRMPPLAENLLLRVASVLRDPVTTTDELIPSGETSSYRSNPPKLAEFALSRRDPGYVGRAKEVRAMEEERRAGRVAPEAAAALAACGFNGGADAFAIASTIYAERPGDGSAREQAASCQRVLGAGANICREFATKRYRSNCINWGMLPLTLPEGAAFKCEPGDWVFVPGARSAVESGAETLRAFAVRAGKAEPAAFEMKGLAPEERATLLAGSLVNAYKAGKSGGTAE